MPTNVLMPQMGESIAEGTIVRWFKNEGEAVVKDEPLLEISTDKVDAEVPAPASGVLGKILCGPGKTVPVETLIGIIVLPGEAAEGTLSAMEVEPPMSASPPVAPQSQLSKTPVAPTPPLVSPETAPQTIPVVDDEADAIRRHSSPLVRQIARENGIDLAQVPGTGIHDRVTKDDILRFIEKRKTAPIPAPSTPPPAQAAATQPAPASSQPALAFTGDVLREPMSIMRQKIAEHMVASRRTSPHVNTVFEVDMSGIVTLRDGRKAAFEATHGLKLTFTPFFLAAVVEGLKAFPAVNASIEGNEVVYHRHINIGVAVSVPNGLIVPVVKHAEELSIIGLQRSITDLATRARNKQLKPDDVQGSTFSVTNPGPYGGLFGLPIINQPNVAILSTGGIHKRPVAVPDGNGGWAIGIRDMVYLAMSFDHRLVDGAMADQFMAQVKEVLEKTDFDLG